MRQGVLTAGRVKLLMSKGEPFLTAHHLAPYRPCLWTLCGDKTAPLCGILLGCKLASGRICCWTARSCPLFFGRAPAHLHTPPRVPPLPGHSGYRSRRSGERKKKSARGCIVDAGLSVLALSIVKKGPKEIEGLTDTTRPRRLGPKRASKIRKLFNLTKEDDVRHYVIKRKIEKEGKKDTYKAPKIQRLVTPQRLQRKRAM